MKNTRMSRLPLRDLLNHIEHRCRELIEHLQMDLTPMTNEVHKLTRPKRTRSAYPSIRTVCNTIERLNRSHEYAKQVTVQIEECIEAIEDRVTQAAKATTTR